MKNSRSVADLAEDPTVPRVDGPSDACTLPDESPADTKQTKTHEPDLSDLPTTREVPWLERASKRPRAHARLGTEMPSLPRSFHRFETEDSPKATRKPLRKRSGNRSDE